MASIIDAALSQIGVPYHWGGSSPGGFDCSGLVQWAASQAGISVPRTSEAQFAASQRIGQADTQPGDLIFFKAPGGGSPPGHVGICYNAGCSQMIDAPNTGAKVRIENTAGFDEVWGFGRIGANTSITPGSGANSNGLDASIAGAVGGAAAGVAGLGIGAAVILVLLGGSLYVFLKRKKR